MQTRRTLNHGGDLGWSALAVHLQPATSGQQGYYLTLFPDQRPPAMVFLRPDQLLQLVELAASPNTTDQAVWDWVARLPLEPLAPCRSLYAKLRALLVDQGPAVLEHARALSAKNDRSPAAEEEAEPEAQAPTSPARVPPEGF